MRLRPSFIFTDGAKRTSRGVAVSGALSVVVDVGLLRCCTGGGSEKRGSAVSGFALKMAEGDRAHEAWLAATYATNPLRPMEAADATSDAVGDAAGDGGAATRE